MSSRRLKHFCELCRKQCKDENGFKCHVNSASHQLRVRDFATNPLEHIEKASKEFEWRFIQHVKTKYAGEAKFLEELYNELIEEKKFLQFNHTQWKNLAEFGLHLKEVRNIQVIGVPPNCKILYLVNKTKDFVEAAKKEKLQNDKEKEKEVFQRSIAARIEREKEIAAKKEAELEARLASLDQERKYMHIPDKLEFNIQGFNADNKRSALYTVQELEKQVKEQTPFYKKKVDNIEKLYEILKKNDNNAEDEQQDVEWIKPGITVKIKPHEIDAAFHNKKVKISRIVQPYIAQIQIGTALIQIDQAYLQTVIPKIGYKVMILNGQLSGQIGTLVEANISEGYGVVEVKQEKKVVSFNMISRFDAQ